MSSQGGAAAIREAIEAKRSKIKTPGVSLKTLERDATRKKAWYVTGQARLTGMKQGTEQMTPEVSRRGNHGIVTRAYIVERIEASLQTAGSETCAR